MTREHLRSGGLSALAVVIAVGLAACGASAGKSAGSASGTPVASPATAASAPASAQPGQSVGVRAAPGYGQLLVDGQNRTLYLFTADRGPRSVCHGDCARAWPPLIVHATPRAGAGVQGGRLSVIRRDDGQLQAAYYGHPLYYYIGDPQPNQINCQDVEEFGGHWWLVKPNGEQNRSTP